MRLSQKGFPWFAAAAGLLAVSAAAGLAPEEGRPRTGAGRDAVTTIDGSRLTGNVLDVEGGKLRLTGAQYGGEVQVLMQAIDSVFLQGGGETRSGQADVALTNGDRLVGDLVAISADAVTVETRGAGRLAMARKVVRSIRLTLTPPVGVLLNSNFDLSEMAPWKADKDGWIVTDGALVCEKPDVDNPVYANLPQKEPVTLVASLQALGKGPVRCDLAVFLNNPQQRGNGAYGTGGLTVRIDGSQWRMMAAAENSSSSSSTGGNAFQRGTFRLAYDPGTGRAQVWVDTQRIINQNTLRIPTGQVVLFNARAPLRVESLRVLSGVVPPEGAVAGGPILRGRGIFPGNFDGPAEIAEIVGDAPAPATKPEAPAPEVPATTTVEFTNGDRVSADAVTLADGQLVLTTTHGELRCPLANLARIVFGQKGSEVPRRRKGDVRVTSAAGRLTLRFDRLTSDSLVGQSEFLGEVKLRRSAVREIKFNPYR